MDWTAVSCFAIVLLLISGIIRLARIPQRKARLASLRKRNLIMTDEEFRLGGSSCKGIILVDLGSGDEYWACFSDASTVNFQDKVVTEAKLLHPTPPKAVLKELESAGRLTQICWRK